MPSSHSPGRVGAAFADPNLIADVALVPLLRLAERPGCLSWSTTLCGSPGRTTAVANAAVKGDDAGRGDGCRCRQH